MSQVTELDKLRRHVKKKITITLRGLRPKSVCGRIKGPKVLLNSIPKAGTHLLERALEDFPLLRNAGERTITAPNRSSETKLDKLRGIKKGQFLIAHLQAHKVILDLIRITDIRVLFMIRDPRDVAISRVKYAMDIDRTHRTHEYFKSLASDDACLMASITGVQNLILPVGKVFALFANWLEEKNVLVCRFEDLIGEMGGGNVEKQVQTLTKIAQHLGINVSDMKLKEIANKIYTPKSSTFNKGKVGAWRESFKEEHRACFQKMAGEMLLRYGYELNNNWRNTA